MAERLYQHEGKTYLIRDVWVEGSDPRKLRRCEYATARWSGDGQSGSLKWHPCMEGVLFANIQPLFAEGDGGQKTLDRVAA